MAPPAVPARRDVPSRAPRGVSALEQRTTLPCGPFLAGHPGWTRRGTGEFQYTLLDPGHHRSGDCAATQMNKNGCEPPPCDGSDVPSKTKRSSRELTTAEKFRQVIPTKETDENIAFTKVGMSDPDKDQQKGCDEEGDGHGHLTRGDDRRCRSGAVRREFQGECGGRGSQRQHPG